MIRIFNGKILKFNLNEVIITSEELWIDGQYIIYIGSEKKEMPHFEKEVNLQGNLIMPGFSNAHTHSLMILFRSLYEGKRLCEWLKCMSPLEKQITEDDAFVISKFAVMNYLANGVTSTFDMCSFKHAETYIAANVSCGFRTGVCCGISLNSKRRIDDIEYLYNKYNNFNPLIRYSLGLHSIYNCDLDILEKISELSHKYKSPVFMHNSETLGELQYSKEKYGTSPTQLLDSYGLFEFGGGGFHCTHLSDEDIRLFTQKDLYAILNITSNLWLASGIPPINQLIDNRVKIALGTDGAGSNCGIDMFFEMRMLALLQRISGEDRLLESTKVIKYATQEGAKLMGFQNCGYIATGNLADLIVVDIERVNMLPKTNLMTNLVFSCNNGNIITTIVGGEILFDRGEYYIGEAYDDIIPKIEKIKARILGE